MGCFHGLYVARVDKTRTDREGSKERGRKGQTEGSRHSAHRRKKQQVTIERRGGCEGGRKKRRVQMKQEEPAHSLTKVSLRWCMLN